MAGKKPRRRRSFTPESKAEVVALVRQPGRTVGRADGLDAAPKELGVFDPSIGPIPGDERALWALR